MKLPTKQELLLSKIWGETQKLKRIGWCNLCVSYKTLGRRFQDPELMALREKGYLQLSTDANTESGVVLRQEYQDMTFAELKEHVKSRQK